MERYVVVGIGIWIGASGEKRASERGVIFLARDQQCFLRRAGGLVD